MKRLLVSVVSLVLIFLMFAASIDVWAAAPPSPLSGGSVSQPTITIPSVPTTSSSSSPLPTDVVPPTIISPGAGFVPPPPPFQRSPPDTLEVTALKKLVDYEDWFQIEHPVLNCVGVIVINGVCQKNGYAIEAGLSKNWVKAAAQYVVVSKGTDFGIEMLGVTIAPEIVAPLKFADAAGNVYDIGSNVYQVNELLSNPSVGSNTVQFGPVSITIDITEQVQTWQELGLIAQGNAQNVQQWAATHQDSISLVNLDFSSGSSVPIVTPVADSEVDLSSSGDTVTGIVPVLQSTFAVAFNLNQTAGIVTAPTSQEVMAIIAQPPPLTILGIVVISAMASALLFFFDHGNSVAFMGKKHGSRLVRWFLPMVVFTPLAYWVTTVALTGGSGIIDYVGLSLFVGFTSGAWIAWIPIFVYAGATNGSTSRKIGWIVKVWLRALVLGAVMIVVGLSLLFVNAAGVSNADISWLVSRLLLLGSSAGGAFLSLMNISSILGLVLEVMVIAAAFAVPTLIRRRYHH